MRGVSEVMVTGGRAAKVDKSWKKFGILAIVGFVIVSNLVSCLPSMALFERRRWHNDFTKCRKTMSAHTAQGTLDLTILF